RRGTKPGGLRAAPPALRSSPDFQGAVPDDVAKISVGRQHRQIVTNAKLRQQGVYRADLNAAAAASVAQLCRVDVIVPVGNQERQRRKPIQYPLASPRPGKALQKLLQNETGGEQCLAGFDRSNQFSHLGRGG